MGRLQDYLDDVNRYPDKLRRYIVVVDNSVSFDDVLDDITTKLSINVIEYSDKEGRIIIDTYHEIYCDLLTYDGIVTIGYMID